MRETEIQTLRQEIEQLSLEIIHMAPGLKEARECFNHLVNKHASLLAEHRDKQKELKLAIGTIIKLDPFKTKKKSLNRTKPISKQQMQLIFSAMSPEDKIQLRKELML